MATERQIALSAACAEISRAGEEEIRLFGEGVNHENDKSEANVDENGITRNAQGPVEVTTNSGALLGLDKGGCEPNPKPMGNWERETWYPNSGVFKRSFETGSPTTRMRN